MSNAAAFLITGSKGGTGATTFVTELARAAARLGENVAIVDADMSGRRTLATLLDAEGVLDRNRTAHIHATVRIGQIDVVELLDKSENIFSIKPAAFEDLARSLENRVVFLDAPRPFEFLVRPFMKRIVYVVVVVEPTTLGVSACRRLLADLARHGVAPNRVSIVLNARGGRPEINTNEVQRLFGTEVLGELPKLADRSYARTVETIAKKILEHSSAGTFPGLQLSTAERRPANSSSDTETDASVGAVSEKQPGDEPQRKHDDPEQRRRDERRSKLKLEIGAAVTSRVDVVAASRAHTDGQKFTELREQIGNVITTLLEGRADVSGQDRAELQQEIIDEQLGLGPLEELMRDEKISEIMVNGPKTIYVERGGKIELADRVFKDERHLRTVIERIVAPLGRRIDESSPMVDARLQDGSRVNAIIEPLALDGSSLTIRRFSKRRLHMSDLVRFGSIPEESVNLLRAMVEAKLNIVVSGGTGSGKTTFLNILSNFIPNDDRILTIEDAAELSLSQEHVVRLETRPANVEGKGAVTIRDLVKNSLRMRPDRIVIGECRGGEALDMLQAMNTGHDGSLTTLHANTPRDALARMETLVLMAGYDLPIRAIREQIASAVDVVVQIERLRDGSRKCSSITEVVGMEGDIVTMQELIKYQQEGIDESGKVVGRFLSTGVLPHNMTKFEETGVRFDVRELSKLQPQRAAAW